MSEIVPDIHSQRLSFTSFVILHGLFASNSPIGAYCKQHSACQSETPLASYRSVRDAIVADKFITKRPCSRNSYNQNNSHCFFSSNGRQR
ncbi:MAG: hypothetical protein LBT05_12330, partial [Planctomycetaceae bacterium]|nr:hypothetical protein [Planctomycetaceae bacterium]